MVWKDGRPEYLKRAEMQKCKIVNVLWVAEQEQRGERLPEADYPAIQCCVTPKRFKDHSSVKSETPEKVRRKRILDLRRASHGISALTTKPVKRASETKKRTRFAWYWDCDFMLKFSFVEQPFVASVYEEDEVTKVKIIQAQNVLPRYNRWSEYNHKLG